MSETEASSAVLRILLTETTPLSLLTGIPLGSRQTQPRAEAFQVPEKMHQTDAPKSSGFSLRTRTQAHLSAASRNLEHHHCLTNPMGAPNGGGREAPPEFPIPVLIHKSGDSYSHKPKASPEKTASTPKSFP